MSEGEKDPTVSALERLFRPETNAVSTITVNAGGVGVWIAATSCIAVLAAVLVGAIFVAFGMSDLNRQLQERRQKDEAQDAYINVIYQNSHKGESK